MLRINNITVRLGGRTILDRASAAVPPGGRVGLIGRNGAGKSTLMKVLVGELDPDEGSIDMPRRTRLGYIAQEAPSGTATPFEAVLSADVERARLIDESEHCTEPDRLGDIHERLLAIDAYTAPTRAAIILSGLQGVVQRWTHCGDTREELEEVFMRVAMGGLRNLQA